MFPDLCVASHNRAQELLESKLEPLAFTHVISINEPGGSPPSSLMSYAGKKLVLYFDDLSSPVFREDFNPPTLADMEKILDFSRDLTSQDRVLVHCTAGVSRSAAAAVALLASKLPPSQESADLVFKRLLAAKSTIYPNSRMVDFADALLGYNGELISSRARFFDNDALIWVPPGDDLLTAEDAE